MSHFLGKWKSNPNSRKNEDEFYQKAGFPQELVERYRKAITTYEYQKNGDTWTITISSDVTPTPRVYTFELGKETVTTDREGKGAKYIAYLDEDGTWTDITKSEVAGWKEIKTKREVKGDKMINIVETDGTWMSHELDRV